MSFFQKLKAGLSKTKEGMLKNLDSLFGGHKIEEEFYEELEEILIMSDVGAAVSDKIVSQLRAKVKETGCRDTAEAKEFLKEIIVQLMQGGEELNLSTQPVGHSGNRRQWSRKNNYHWENGSRSDKKGEKSSVGCGGYLPGSGDRPAANLGGSGRSGHG